MKLSSLSPFFNDVMSALGKPPTPGRVMSSLPSRTDQEYQPEKNLIPNILSVEIWAVRNLKLVSFIEDDL